MATFKQVREASERAKALGDPTRLSVALELQERYPDSENVNKLADSIGRHQSLVSRHLGKLVASDLASKSPSVGNYVTYKLTPLGNKLVSEVMKG